MVVRDGNERAIVCSFFALGIELLPRRTAQCRYSFETLRVIWVPHQDSLYCRSFADAGMQHPDGTVLPR